MTVYELNLGEQYRAAQVVASLERLLALDSVWTQYLDKSTSPPTEDVAHLEKLATELDSLLDTITREAEWFSELVNQHRQAPNAAWVAILDQPPLSTALSDVVQKIAYRHRDFASFAQSSCRELLAIAPREKADLAERRQLIAAGRRSPGDVSKQTECAARGFLVGVTMGLFAANPLGAALGVGNGLLGMAASGCFE
jgi:hypothetical protein